MSTSTAERESCPNVDRCPMFPLFTTQTILRVLQHEYCHHRFTECERYKTLQSGTMPDKELLPDGTRLPTL